MFLDSFFYMTPNEAWKSIMHLKWCVIQKHRFLIPPFKFLWMALGIILSRIFSSALDSLVISFNKGINYSLQEFLTIVFGITASAVIFLQCGFFYFESVLRDGWLTSKLKYWCSGHYYFLDEAQFCSSDTNGHTHPLGNTYKCKWVSGDHNMSSTLISNYTHPSINYGELSGSCQSPEWLHLSITIADNMGM